jgi:hypothetical protein
MPRLLTIIFLLLSINTALAQKPKDTLIYNLPVVNDKLIYQGNGTINGKSRPALEAATKNWFASYFKANDLGEPYTPFVTIGNDTSSFLLKRGILEYKVKPGMANINFVALIRIKVACTDNHYSYKIDSILFRPKNNTLNGIGYENDPNYLISIYKRKHLGISTAWEVSRGQIREYLGKINGAVRDCIASLNKAMAN